MARAQLWMVVAQKVSAVHNMDGVEPLLSTVYRAMPFSLLPENAEALRNRLICP